MSTEYFGMEPLSGDESKFYICNDQPEAKIGDCAYIPPSSPDNERLHEMGEALEIAESKCNTLKEQLDQMKSMYREKFDQIEETHKESVDEEVRSQPNLKRKNLTRQNSNAIGSDNSGAAVLTINNILSGITNSINRLSELHTYMETDVKKVEMRRWTPNDHQMADRIERDFSQEPSSGENILVTREITYSQSSVKHKPKRKEIKKRTKHKHSTTSVDRSSISLVHLKSREQSTGPDDKKSSTTNVKKTRRNIKRLKQISKTSVTKTNKSGNVKSKIARSKGNHQMVEIYHNKAAKETDSDDSPEEDYNPKVQYENKKSKIKQEVPPLNIFDIKPMLRRDNNNNNNNKVCLSPIEEQQDHYPDEDNRHEYMNCTHSYEAPTIASRMKQVAKNVYREYRQKTIPFCAAASTTPSHNIGINIQQVMSIIKTGQPMQGISPTLVHNIGIAAERLNNPPLSAIVSSIGSKIAYNSCYACPMLKNNVNYQQMQEMAKAIPEDDEECLCEGAEEAYNETVKASETVWSIDPTSQIQCTCIQRPGVGFQQVLNKYQHIGQQLNASQSQYAKRIYRKSYEKYKHIKSVYAQNNDANRKAKEVEMEPPDTNLPLRGKEKVLKSVLMNLHDEFSQLSQNYDDLSKQIMDSGGEVNDDNTKELERLDGKLNEKEEEIQMVLALYNEVVTLKQQVRALKEKASLASLMVVQQKQQHQMIHQRQVQMYQQQQLQPAAQQQQYYLPRKDTSAAGHLNKLLKHIQTFQSNLRTGGGGGGGGGKW